MPRAANSLTFRAIPYNSERTSLGDDAPVTEAVSRVEGPSTRPRRNAAVNSLGGRQNLLGLTEGNTTRPAARVPSSYAPRQAMRLVPTAASALEALAVPSPTAAWSYRRGPDSLSRILDSGWGPWQAAMAKSMENDCAAEPTALKTALYRDLAHVCAELLTEPARGWATKRLKFFELMGAPNQAFSITPRRGGVRFYHEASQNTWPMHLHVRSALTDAPKDLFYFSIGRHELDIAVNGQSYEHAGILLSHIAVLGDKALRNMMVMVSRSHRPDIVTEFAKALMTWRFDSIIAHLHNFLSYFPGSGLISGEIPFLDDKGTIEVKTVEVSRVFLSIQLRAFVDRYHEPAIDDDGRYHPHFTAEFNTHERFKEFLETSFYTRDLNAADIRSMFHLALQRRLVEG